MFTKSVLLRNAHGTNQMLEFREGNSKHILSVEETPELQFVLNKKQKREIHSLMKIGFLHPLLIKLLVVYPSVLDMC